MAMMVLEIRIIVVVILKFDRSRNYNKIKESEVGSDF